MKAQTEALVVEDNLALLETLAELLQERGGQVRRATSVAEATQAVGDWIPDLVLLDFMLPDGTGVDVLRELERLHPAPAVVAMSGEAGPAESFELARAGVRCFLPKPFQLEQVQEAIDEALDLVPDPLRDARAVVGKVPIKDLEAGVRRAMVGEALAQSGGSVRRAAALLGISRQLLQHILKSPSYQEENPAGG